MRILVGVTGASGAIIAQQLLDALGKHGIERHLIVSESAQKVLKYENNGTTFDGLSEYQYTENDIHTKICSGSFEIDAMVIAPCSINTLGHIANGLEHNAITRAAGVNLKQERKLILVTRDTPLSLPALKNMVKAKQAGCTILPPMIPYYTQPKTINECTDYVVGRILEVLRIQHDLYPRWDK